MDEGKEIHIIDIIWCLTTLNDWQVEWVCYHAGTVLPQDLQSCSMNRVRSHHQLKPFYVFHDPILVEHGKQLLLGDGRRRNGDKTVCDWTFMQGCIFMLAPT